MTAAKRSPPKTAPPAPLPVPRIRAMRSEDTEVPIVEPPQMRPRRNRKPKFVF